MRARMVRSLVSTCLVAASVVAPPAGAGADESSADVPFDLYQHHLIVTRGSIGPLAGLSLLIDTGSIPSMVDGRIARKLKLRAESSTLVAFGQAMPIESAVLGEGGMEGEYSPEYLIEPEHIREGVAEV